MRTFFSLFTVSTLMGLNWQGSAQVPYDIKTSSAGLLHSTASPSTLAPVGTKLWFVTDFSGDGLIGFSSADVLASVMDNILAGIGDDQLFLQTQIQIFPGSVSVQYDLPAADVSPHNTYYAILWNESGGAAGTVGSKFDYELMQHIPLSGDPSIAQMLINSDMFADTYSVIPEPAETAAFAGLALLGGAFLWRRCQKVVAIAA